MSAAATDEDFARRHKAASDLPAFARHLGIRLVSLHPDKVVAEFVVADALRNRNGVLHGGAEMGVADVVGGTATFLNLPAGCTTSTIESKTNFFASVGAGETARAEATPLHRGRSTQVWQTRITRADGKLAALVTQTQIVMPGK